MKKLLGKDESGNVVKLCHDLTICEFADLNCEYCEFKEEVDEMKPFKKFRIENEE
jgi:protein-disulfide isomerase